MAENEVLGDLGDICIALWEIDIPSPTTLNTLNIITR